MITYEKPFSSEKGWSFGFVDKLKEKALQLSLSYFRKFLFVIVLMIVLNNPYKSFDRNIDFR
jgi:hypothetical protein